MKTLLAIATLAFLPALSQGAYIEDLIPTKAEADQAKKEVSLVFSRLSQSGRRLYGVEVVWVKASKSEGAKCVLEVGENSHFNIKLDRKGDWIPFVPADAEGEGWWVRIINAQGQLVGSFASSAALQGFAPAQPLWKPADIDPKGNLKRRVEPSKMSSLSVEERKAHLKKVVGSWRGQLGPNVWEYSINADGTCMNYDQTPLYGTWTLEGRQIVLVWKNHWASHYDPDPAPAETASRGVHRYKTDPPSVATFTKIEAPSTPPPDPGVKIP